MTAYLQRLFNHAGQLLLECKVEDDTNDRGNDHGALEDRQRDGEWEPEPAARRGEGGGEQ